MEKAELKTNDSQDRIQLTAGEERQEGCMDTAIVVKELSKIYQPKSERRQAAEVKAVDGISFEVGRGEFFGLLGPNGAGKTTTIGILTTRIRLTAGMATIEGIDVARHPVAVKRLI